MVEVLRRMIVVVVYLVVERIGIVVVGIVDFSVEAGVIVTRLRVLVIVFRHFAFRHGIRLNSFPVGRI